MNLPIKVNQNIKIKTEEKTYKVVGIVDRSEKSYIQDYRINVFTNFNNLKNENATLRGVVTLRGNKDSIKTINDLKLMEGKNAISNFQLEYELSDLNELNEIESEKSLKITVYATAFFFIFNILYGSYSNMLPDIGILRSIGERKIGILKFLLSKSFIVYLLGIAIGIGLGCLFVYLSLKISMLSVYMPKTFNIKVYMTWKDIFKSGVPIGFIVLIGTIIPFIKVLKHSPIELIRRSRDNNSEKTSLISKILGRSFLKKIGIVSFMSIINLSKNKIRAFLIVITLVLGGNVLITQVSEITRDIKEETNIGVSRLGDNRFSLGINPNYDYNISGYDDKDISYIENLKGVENVTKSKTSDIRINNEDNLSRDLYIKSYDTKIIEKFTEKGNILTDNKEKGNYYNGAIFTNTTKPYNKKDEKTGDILEVEIKTIEKDKIVYKPVKIKIVAIINETDWIYKEASNSGDKEIIINNENFEKISKSKKYNQINIESEVKKDSKIYNNIKKFFYIESKNDIL